MRVETNPIIAVAEQWWKPGDNALVNEGIWKEGVACDSCNGWMDTHGFIQTAHGGYAVCPGDYVIAEDRTGNVYPMKPAQFQQNFRIIPESMEFEFGPLGKLMSGK